MSQHTGFDAEESHGIVHRMHAKRMKQQQNSSCQSASCVQPYNVLRYSLGQHYDSHHDVFDPAIYGPERSSRIVTALIYLAAHEGGGETIFPFEGVNGLKNSLGFDYKSCDQGLKYKPRFGDALMFWSVGIDGMFDKRSLHWGCPVKAGTKWVATKWIRDRPVLG